MGSARFPRLQRAGAEPLGVACTKRNMLASKKEKSGFLAGAGTDWPEANRAATAAANNPLFVPRDKAQRGLTRWGPAPLRPGAGSRPGR